MIFEQAICADFGYAEEKAFGSIPTVVVLFWITEFLTEFFQDTRTFIWGWVFKAFLKQGIKRWVTENASWSLIFFFRWPSPSRVVIILLKRKMYRLSQIDILENLKIWNQQNVGITMATIFFKFYIFSNYFKMLTVNLLVFLFYNNCVQVKMNWRCSGFEHVI